MLKIPAGQVVNKMTKVRTGKINTYTFSPHRYIFHEKKKYSEKDRQNFLVLPSLFYLEHDLLINIWVRDY